VAQGGRARDQAGIDDDDHADEFNRPSAKARLANTAQVGTAEA
jgi:hypothetical protein